MTGLKTGTLVLLLATATATGAEEIHKWVDADGHVHFGDEASAKRGSATVTPKGGSFVKTVHTDTGSLPADSKKNVPPGAREQSNTGE